MSEEKKKRNKIIGISIGILVVLLVVISSTYAYWQITKSQDGSNNIVAACLKLEMTEEKGTFGINPAWPISDDDGLNLTGYTFKVTNSCGTDVNYIIGMDSLEVSGALYLSYDSIKLSIDGNKPVIYGEQEDIDHIEENDPYIIRDSKKINTAIVKGNTSNEHNVKVWIDADAPVSENNKTFSGRVFITGGQNILNDKPMIKLVATGDISKTEECDVINYNWQCTPLDNHNNDVKYSLYADGTLNIYGTGDIKSFEIEDEKYLPLYSQLLKDYAIQNSIELSSEEVTIINNQDSISILGALFSESDEYIEHITNGQIKTYEDAINNFSILVGEDTARILLSLKSKMPEFPHLLNINISDGVSSIGKGAFYNTFVQDIKISSSVNSIDMAAFYTSYIKDISIEEGVESIGSMCFMRATITDDLKLVSTINELKGDAFQAATIKSLELSNNNLLSTITDDTIFNNITLEELIIPQNIIKIHENVFNGEDFSNTIVKLYGSERTIEGLDLTQFKEVIWNYIGE